jgi:hypothetical protein
LNRQDAKYAKKEGKKRNFKKVHPSELNPPILGDFEFLFSPRIGGRGAKSSQPIKINDTHY